MRKYKNQRSKTWTLAIGIGVALLVLIGVANLGYLFPHVYEKVEADVQGIFNASNIPPLDTALYDLKLNALANNKISSTTASTTIFKWPVKAAYPNSGAILP